MRAVQPKNEGRTNKIKMKKMKTERVVNRNQTKIQSEKKKQKPGVKK